MKPSSRRDRGVAKPRIVVLGAAGAMGRIIVRDLVRTGRDIATVVAADRDLTALRNLGVETVQVDVTNPRRLQSVLSGAFATIASLPYRLNLPVMRGALAAGAHHVDLGGLFHTTREQLALRSQFERRGRMAILGMGSAPGILNVLAVHCARDMEMVREIHCLVGSMDRTRFRTAPPLGFDYSPDTLLDEFVIPSAVFRDGAFTSVPPLDPGERVTVGFPAPVGTIAVDTTIHSEVATLPLSFADRGIREVTFRQGFDAAFLDKLGLLVKLGLADDTRALSEVLASPRRFRRAVRNGRSPGASGVDVGSLTPRQVLIALLGRLPAAVPVGKPVRYEVLRALVRGKQRGRAVTVIADCHAGPDAGAGVGPDIDTGAPPSIAVQLMIRGEIEIRPGTWAPEQVVPVAPFVRELTRRGMRVTRRVQRGASRRF